MDIYKAFDLLERVEHQMASLYRQLKEEFRLNREVFSFFSILQLEEESHVQLIRMERRIVQSSPRAFTDVKINLSEVSSILETIENLKSARLELPEMLGRIYTLESSPAEKYLIEALMETNDELREFLTQMSNTFSAHAEKIASFAHSLGVEVDTIENRFLRKARVGYAEGVMINGSLRGRGVDISEGGLFVMTGRSLRTGDTVQVQFPVLGVAINAAAAIQYGIENVGIGLRFTVIEEKDRDLIKQYVQTHLEEKGQEKQKRVLVVGHALQAGRDTRVYLLELVAAGFKVVDVAGFEDTIAILKKMSDFSCLVFLIETETDVNYYLIHLLATMAFYRSVPVLVISNNGDKHFHETLTKKGAKKILMRHTTSPKRLAEEISASNA
jgi:hypothetical protein